MQEQLILWTYDTSLGLPKDQLRLAIGDTIELDPLFQDEECEYALTLAGDSLQIATLYLIEKAALKFARQASMSTPDLRLELSQRAEQYRLLAKDIRAQALVAQSIPLVFGGGISVSDKASRSSNADRVTPVFTVGQHDPFGKEDR